MRRGGHPRHARRTQGRCCAIAGGHFVDGDQGRETHRPAARAWCERTRRRAVPRDKLLRLHAAPGSYGSTAPLELPIAGILSSMRAPMKSRGNNPKRRIVPTGYFSQAELAGFAVRARYEGSALHKLKPADYGFHPPTNPRASKSACDDIRIIKRQEASDLLKAAFGKGMVSACEPQALPKYAWAVDADSRGLRGEAGPRGLPWVSPWGGRPRNARAP